MVDCVAIMLNFKDNIDKTTLGAPVFNALTASVNIF